MNIQFATCNRVSALRFIQQIYPSKTITDTPDCAKPLLDFVEQDLVRIQDPMMYGNKIQVVPGKQWREDADTRKAVVDACRLVADRKEGRGMSKNGVYLLHARGGMFIRVRVIGERTENKQERALVEPISGEGSAWVNKAELRETNNK